MTTIGWYVHHQGGGHLGRLRAILPRLDADVICFSSLSEPDDLPSRVRWITLEQDSDTVDGRDPARADPNAGGTLHWAPLQHGGHRSRLARVAGVLAAEPVDAFVVDVSVEVTLFVRLLGIPVVVMAQPGDRTDTPHRLAYGAATAIIAPWPEHLVSSRQLDGYDVTFTGGISRHEGRPVSRSEPGVDVLLLGGRGGSTVTPGEIAAARESTPGRRWRVLTDGGEWVADPWALLTSARVVVAWAGQNSIADLAAASARAIVVPQPRPFREQVATGEALAAAGLALVEGGWPEPERWPALLDAADGLTPDWDRWQVDGAALRAAEAIQRIAERWPR